MFRRVFDLWVDYSRLFASSIVMAKRPLVGQPSLFDDEPPASRASVTNVGLAYESTLKPVGSYADALKEQIVRDSLVLQEDVDFHVPSTAFFVDRIAAYKAELDRIGG